ncbi:MAG: periplasmic heavy metal sensor [Bacteroidales bacterium]|nr:periplasmic heavy metal sensor [Bacteroidales bacterium]
MNFFNKQRLLIWALIILVVINIGAIGTIIYQNYRFNQQFAPPPMDREKFDRDDEHDFFFKRELDLDKEQLQQFREHKKEFFDKVNELRSDIYAQRQEMIRELSKDEPNKERLSELTEEIGRLHSQKKKITINHFMELKELVNPEQRRRLNRMIKEMIRNDGPHYEDKHHKGKRYRRRHNDDCSKNGKRFENNDNEE